MNDDELLKSYKSIGLTPEEMALFVRAEIIPVKVMKRAIAGINAADQCDQAGHYDYELRRALKTVLEWYQAPVFIAEFAVSKRDGWIPKWWPRPL